MSQYFSAASKAALLCASALVSLTLAASACADEGHHHSHGSPGAPDVARPDSHAPIGVMGDHRHKAGDWMASYRFMGMTMKDNLVGEDNVTPAQIRTHFGKMVVPTKMDMDMHMAGLMYGWSDRITLMGMVSYVEKEMDHVRPNGATFQTQAKGMGDSKISALIGLEDHKPEGLPGSLHATIGFSLPTGSIDERDATPANPRAKLPYPMQLGSGTFDFTPGLTWAHRLNDDRTSLGAQYAGAIRLGDNDNNYTLGDKHQISVWAMRLLSDHVSLSGRVKGEWEGDIDGADPDLNPNMIQTADPDLHGGERIEASIGLNISLKGIGPTTGNRLAVEYTEPLYQDLNGPQMERQSTLTIGWQGNF